MHSALPKKFILFTGVTSGIGYAMIQELTRKYHEKYYLYYIIVCRCLKRGREIKKVVSMYKNVEVALVNVDLNDIKSVLHGCSIIKKRYSRIDVMFLNAGIMPVQSIRWNYLVKSFFNGDINKIVANGEGLFELNDVINKDGIPTVFTTNVLGHFIMVKELVASLENRKDGDEIAKIIWTSSMSSNKDFFDIEDIMCLKGNEPYPSSKFLVDAVAVAWNDYFKNGKVKSMVVDPGTVVTNLMTSFLPVWFLFIFVAPIFFILRLTNPANNIFPANASPAFMHAFAHGDAGFHDDDDGHQQQLEVSKLCSSTNIRCDNFVRRLPLDVEREKAAKIFNHVSKLAERVVVASSDAADAM